MPADKDTAKPTAGKKLATKARKVLSQAATQRQEQERLEAQRTKTEKLAEGIKRRSTVLSKHDSVTKNVDAVKAAAKKAKTFELRPVKKVRQKAPMPSGSEFEVFQAQMQQREQEIHRLLHQATVIKNCFENMARRETVKFHEALRDCYGIYQHIQSSPEPYAFYDALRTYFKQLGTAQSNSPDEGLLVRFVFSQKSNKQISEYATVMRYALTKVPKARFIDWYTTATQTRILQKARKAGNAKLNDRLQRARVVLQRYFDLREQWPLVSLTTLSFWLKNKCTCLMISSSWSVAVSVVLIVTLSLMEKAPVVPSSPLLQSPRYISFRQTSILPTTSWIALPATLNPDWRMLKRKSKPKPTKCGPTI
jgi:hypothetical protein